VYNPEGHPVCLQTVKWLPRQNDSSSVNFPGTLLSPNNIR